MKKLVLYIFIITIFCNISFAETKEELRAHYILNNMQQDYTICYIFYKIGAEGLRKTDENNVIAQGIERSADTSLKLAYETGELMNMKVEAMAARVKLEMKTQSTEIENDYVNASILLEKYGLLCKNLIENKKQRIEFWKNKAENKFK
jgi:hypothetical protein